MRVLVLGAGGVGGYFGGRLAQKGVDVTFLVRENRRKQLEERGLRINSVHGDYHFSPRLITSGEQIAPYDVILFSTKAYHFADATPSIDGYVGENTMILPLLNGIAHTHALQKKFGEQRVLGGLCYIETTLNEHGDVVHTSQMHEVVFGDWLGGKSERVDKLEQLFAGANATFRASEDIKRQVWHKYLFITMMSGITTLMNSAVGPIRDTAHGKELTLQLADEIAQVMRAMQAEIDDDIVQKQMISFEKQGYWMKSSMLRDMEKGLPVEADHLQGYLLKSAEEHGIATPLLRIVYNNLKVYEIKRTHKVEV